MRLSDSVNPTFIFLVQVGQTSSKVNARADLSSDMPNFSLVSKSDFAILGNYTINSITVIFLGCSGCKSLFSRHSLLTEFFKMIGIDDETANRDAEGIEHHLQPQTLKRLQEFVKLIRNNSGLNLRK
jgi:hypothetical protein